MDIALSSGAILEASCICLLQRELESRGHARASDQFDVRYCHFVLPPTVIRAFPNETLSVRIRRYYMQLELILTRLRFHVVEGIRFAVESRRWRRIKELAL